MLAGRDEVLLGLFSFVLGFPGRLFALGDVRLDRPDQLRLIRV
jgi:hypothetical protein